MVDPARVSKRDVDTTQVFSIGDPTTRGGKPRDRCTLTVLEGPGIGRVLAVESEFMLVGRGASVDGRIDEDSLSREHARVFQLRGCWFVEDLQSTNGTWVAGERLSEPRQLADGDRVQMGKRCILRVSLHDEQEQDAAKQLYESAVTDPLTGVHNRRYLDERLEGEHAYAARHHTPLSVLLFDIDRFKGINDSMGHLAGDAVLRVLAQSVRKMVRTEDILARYGGEEFAVVARGIDPRNAFILAERIRTLIESLRVPWEGSEVRVTISVGVATWQEANPYPDVTALLSACDTALYRAKETGRNRCCVAD